MPTLQKAALASPPPAPLLSVTWSGHVVPGLLCPLAQAPEMPQSSLAALDLESSAQPGCLEARCCPLVSAMGHCHLWDGYPTVLTAFLPYISPPLEFFS